jgi:hypothetical protein
MLRRRIVNRVTAVTFVALGLVVALPGAAAATAPPVAVSSPPSSTDSGGYPAQGPLLTLSAGSVNVGAFVTVNGRGFQSGENVDISVTYAGAAHALGSGGPTTQPAALTVRHSAGQLVSAGHAVADGDGGFSMRIKLTQAGSATVTATGEQSHVSLTAPISVLLLASGASTTSTKSVFSLSRLQLLILLALLASLVPAGVVWQRLSRKPSAANSVATT